jgi:hypothetical protein
LSEYDEILRGKQSPNKKDKDTNNKKKILDIRKHSALKLLAESVIVGQKPYFAVSRINGGNEVRITLEESIEDDVTRFIPLNDNIAKPYIFASREEFDKYIERVKGETLDTLYKKVKSIWAKYIDADNFHISLCAADTIFTYFQDKLGMTHYLFFVGGNDTGKSNNLRIIHEIGYRNFLSLGITDANIYTFLRNGEEGQGTICEDEADTIDIAHEKMKIYKSGHQIGTGVVRTDMPQGVRSQNRWNTFCIKFFAAERLPDPTLAKGFLQRIIELKCRDGYPDYDVAEVLDVENDDDESQALRHELNDTHRLLLAYRLLYFHDKIPNIKLNIINREKQLFKPLLRVFQNTKTLSELLQVVSEFVSRRREKNVNSLEAFLYETVAELTKNNGLELESSRIWNTVKSTLSGFDVPYRPLTYESDAFSTLSQKRVVEILKDIFGAKEPTHKGNKRTLIFDADRLERLRRRYSVKVEVRVQVDSPPEDRAKAEADEADETGCRGYADNSSSSDHEEMVDNGSINEEKSNNNDTNNEEITSHTGPDTPTHNQLSASSASSASNLQHAQTIDAATPTHPLEHPNFDTAAIERIGSAMEIIDHHRIVEINLQHISRIGKSATWKCDSCKIKADIHFMKSHKCSGIDYRKGSTK